jgi:hypothetical protein
MTRAATWLTVAIAIVACKSKEPAPSSGTPASAPDAGAPEKTASLIDEIVERTASEARPDAELLATVAHALAVRGKADRARAFLEQAATADGAANGTALVARAEAALAIGDEALIAPLLHALSTSAGEESKEGGILPAMIAAADHERTRDRLFEELARVPEAKDPTWRLVARFGASIDGPIWERLVAWARSREGAYERADQLAALAVVAHRAKQPAVARALIAESAERLAALPRDDLGIDIDTLQAVADAEAEMGDLDASAKHAAEAVKRARRFGPDDRAQWYATDAELAALRGDEAGLEAAEERALADLSRATEDADVDLVRAELAVGNGLAGSRDAALETLGVLPAEIRTEYVDYLAWTFGRFGRWDEALATVETIADPSARDRTLESLLELRTVGGDLEGALAIATSPAADHGVTRADRVARAYALRGDRAGLEAIAPERLTAVGREAAVELLVVSLARAARCTEALAAARELLPASLHALAAVAARCRDL